MSKFKIPWIAAIALASTTLLAGLAGESGCATAQSSSCRSICLSQYNQCRITTKGSPSCDAQYQSCLQACISTMH